jgi:hypothetical protein
MSRPRTTTDPAKLRTYQVLGTALAEEKRVGLLTEEEFTRRHRELYDDIFGEVAA